MTLHVNKLKPSYPCHPSKRVVFNVITDLVPIQRFERKCPVCNIKWNIEVTQIKHTEGLLMNKLEWTVDNA